MQEQDSLLDVFIYESQQLLESLEDVLLHGEKQKFLSDEQINEVFRIMHTIKGSAAMMEFENLAKLSHAVEDLFAQIREKKARSGDWDDLFDIVLTANDALKGEISKIQSGQASDGDFSALIGKIHHYLDLICRRVPPAAGEAAEAAGEEADFSAPCYKLKVLFEPDCQMENMRAFGVVNSLVPHCQRHVSVPGDFMAADASAQIIKNGLVVYLRSLENPDSLEALLGEAMFVSSFSILPLADECEELPESLRPRKKAEADTAAKDTGGAAQAQEAIAKQNFISVNVNKLDKLMDLVGELVTSESMVTRNPEIVDLHVETFERSCQQLKKLITEVQDTVMSIRMIPVSNIFQKMHRIVRDVAKKVNKEVELVVIGEETEVDKNVIDNLSDPIMHLIRNSVDHGIELPAERVAKGKPPVGKLTLEARNTGGDVMIFVSDDGAGLNRETIIKKAIDRGLTARAEHEISDKEAYSFIFQPGFSTNETVTEFSGRGVGMDVVRRNIDKIGGAIQVDSAENEGTTTTIRIPLTLAIIDGMKLRVGKLIFIIPLLSIQESFKPNRKDVVRDPGEREMIMIRGKCYPIVRLHTLFGIQPEVTELEDGILVMVHTDSDTFCLFADELVGEQQAVIKPLPTYILKHNTGLHGLGGCAIMGDGSISLIIDINNLVS